MPTAQHRWTQAYAPGVPATFDLPTQDLPALLGQNARLFPSRRALVFFGKATSYRALDLAVDHFAMGLSLLGVRRGDRVALYLPNSPQYVIAFYAALRLGAVAVPVNPLYVARELEHQLSDCGAKVVVTFGPYLSTLQQVRARTSLEWVLVANLKDDLPWPQKLAFTLFRERREGHRVRLQGLLGVRAFRQVLAEGKRALKHHPVARAAIAEANAARAMRDLACLLYTGGTTGTPKGAELTHQNLTVNAYQCHLWFQTAIGREVVPCALPFSHSYGLTTCLNYGILAAATLLLIPDPRDIRHLLRTISAERATFLPGVPTLFRAISDHPDVERYDLRSIRACISGGGPLPPDIKSRFESLTGGVVVEGYGLTEASPVTHANPVLRGGKSGSVGLPWPEVDCRVVDLSDAMTPLAPGRIGELWVKGPQVMRGYWRQPDETKAVLTPDGWLKTGDLMSMDEAGYCFLHARKKDLIIAGGFKIFPGEVEAIVAQHPRVAEVAAVGVPHPYRGETVKIAVVLRPGETLSAEEIMDWCRERMAKYKVPKIVEFRQELPKNALGKVLRRTLVDNSHLGEKRFSARHD